MLDKHICRTYIFNDIFPFEASLKAIRLVEIVTQLFRLGKDSNFSEMRFSLFITTYPLNDSFVLVTLRPPFQIFKIHLINGLLDQLGIGKLEIRLTMPHQQLKRCEEPQLR